MNKNNPIFSIIINMLFIVALFLSIPPIGDGKNNIGNNVGMILSIISFVFYEILNSWKNEIKLYSCFVRILVFILFVWGLDQRFIK